MRELFIYYRVYVADAAVARAAVLGFQTRLQASHPQLIARLLRRSEEIDGRQTWMEIYSTDPMREPAGVSDDMQSDIEAQARALLPLLDGPRHTEVFIACAS